MTFKNQLKNYLQKIPAFISGMLVGSILTGAFFLLKINEYILQIKDALYPKVTIVNKKNENDLKNNKPKLYKKNTSTQMDKKNTDTGDTNLELVSEQTETGTAIVEEKIISQKEIKIIHLENTSSDTLLHPIANVPTYTHESTIKIVFKKTPFNNKGYYFENNQLILYGLEDIPYINLYEYKGELYLKYDKLVFQLPYSNDFQSLIKVEDDYLLAKMN